MSGIDAGAASVASNGCFPTPQERMLSVQYRETVSQKYGMVVKSGSSKKCWRRSIYTCIPLRKGSETGPYCLRPTSEEPRHKQFLAYQHMLPITNANLSVEDLRSMLKHAILERDQAQQHAYTQIRGDAEVERSRTLFLGLQKMKRTCSDLRNKYRKAWEEQAEVENALRHQLLRYEGLISTLHQRLYLYESPHPTPQAVTEPLDQCSGGTVGGSLLPPFTIEKIVHDLVDSENITGIIAGDQLQVLTSEPRLKRGTIRSH
ncbi:hypothetical protein IFR05_014623 [Cadophora sp. M221]|nr:hypothetical protein IFR05_014623 [Cadophora sp. M221]